MPLELVNGTALFYEAAGRGDPLVLVHGSWVEGPTWALVVPGLADTFQVVTYDRRGHGKSGGSPAAGTVHDDVADLVALIETLGLTPANLVANSFGACIALRVTVERPDLVRRTLAHEPPLMALLADDSAMKPILDDFTEAITTVHRLLEAGDDEDGARQFVETIALGPGMWSQLPPPMQEMFVRHAPTFLGELHDPDCLTIDVEALARVSTPVLLSEGDQSPPMFSPIIERLAHLLPGAQRHTFIGAGHVPQVTHPDDYVAVVRQFVQSP